MPPYPALQGWEARRSFGSNESKNNFVCFYPIWGASPEEAEVRPAYRVGKTLHGVPFVQSTKGTPRPTFPFSEEIDGKHGGAFIPYYR